MNAKTIKLIRKFVRYSDGNYLDVKRIKKNLKALNWIGKTRARMRMLEVTSDTHQPIMNEPKS